MSFPIYLLDLNEGEPTIVFPEGKVDLDHSDFWEGTVAGIVASHFKLNPKDSEEPALLPATGADQRRDRLLR